jgi:hypothetical protein
MLTIPLRHAEALETTPPAWDELPDQLSGTPPSIYVLTARAFAQPDPADGAQAAAALERASPRSDLHRARGAGAGG